MPEISIAAESTVINYMGIWLSWTKLGSQKLFLTSSSAEHSSHVEPKLNLSFPATS